MAYSGKFKPKNPIKYQGDHTNIVYRSSWETKFMKWADTNPDVISWSSEEIIVPYFLELDRKNHRYFPDFLMTIKDPNTGVNTTYLTEVKPRKQIDKPKDPGRRSTRYINEMRTWICNQTKWQYADAYARARGWKFIVLDEYMLGIKKRSNKNIN